jgi:energy-coupling factor transport system permease protein
LTITVDAALRALLEPPAPTAYHRLNPLTKVAIAAVTTLGALVLGGYLAPALLLATLVLPGAVAARRLARVLRTAVVLTLPLALAVTLVSVFTRSGETVLFVVGPFDATLEGVDFAARVTIRVFVMAAALSLFGLTTAPRALIADLERRGVSPRVAFAGASVLNAVPAMVERGRQVLAAQRSRGLDSEGSLRRRVAGVLPLVGPTVIGALQDVETRSLALEARAFGHPGPRHPLWAPADTAGERAARWLLLVALTIVVIGSIAGALPHVP